MKQPRVRRSHQQGIAAILILVMVGLSLTATMLGSAHYLRSSQEQHTALHAQSIAQARVWTAAEALRRYLEAVAQAGEWDSLVASLALPAQVSMGLNGVGEAHVIQVDTGATPPRLTARLTARAAEASRAEASSVLEVVYSVAPGVAGSNDNVITFNRDLRLGGSITVQAEANRDYQLNVRGNLIATSGNSITGISIIRATESIDIGSGSSFDELHANGDIRLSGSVSGQQNLLARGNICLSGGASAMGQVRANGSVIGDGGVKFGAISSLGSNDETGPELCEPPSLAVDNSGKPYGVDLRGNSSADSVRSKASVRVNSGSIRDLLSEGDLVDTNWGGSVHGQIGGQLLPTHDNPDLPASVQVSPGLVVPVSPVPPVSLNTIEFNAYDLRQDANYAFWVDSSGYRMVTVKDVNGVEDRHYYLGNYPSGPNHLDRLCTALAPGSSPSDPRCSTPAKEQSIPVCKGHSEWNGCFAYKANEQQWELNGVSMAQGIVWFEGNVQLGNGDYYATFIATENITTSGGHKTTAPNYAGYSRRNGLQHGMCTDLVFPKYYPTQLCQGSSYNHAAAGGLGNYALLAGSCDPAFPAECRYQGGNISTGASSIIRGAIKAGNEFRSGGSSAIHGYITALALGEEHDNSSMGGSTNIILTNLPEGYDPSGDSEGSGESATNASAQILWGRYL